jgi:hypothetical protein
MTLPSPDPDQPFNTFANYRVRLGGCAYCAYPFGKSVFMKSLYPGTLISRYREVLCSFGCGLLAFALVVTGRASMLQMYYGANCGALSLGDEASRLLLRAVGKAGRGDEC